jgi:hypothetical protein
MVYSFLQQLWLNICIWIFFLITNRCNSHGYAHAIRVADLTNKLMIETQKNHTNKTTLDFAKYKKIAIIAAKLHDVWDHKYVSNPKNIKMLVYFVFVPFIKFDDWLRILWIVDNVSLSKEKKSGRPSSDILTDMLRDFVSDADKIDSLGKTGAQRAAEFAKTIGEDIEEHQIWLYDERISNVCDYVRTDVGKKIATFEHGEYIKECFKTIEFSNIERRTQIFEKLQARRIINKNRK